MMSPSRPPRILLVTPPMMQLNAAYPAVPLLAGHLRAHGCAVIQYDAALELALRLFSRSGLEAVHDELRAAGLPARIRRFPSVRGFTTSFKRYVDTVEPVVSFLQGRRPALAPRIAGRGFLPEGPRFGIIEGWDRVLEANGSTGAEPFLTAQFGRLGIDDRARYLASLFVDDLADVIREGIDGRFELSRYAEKLAFSLPMFAPMRAELERPPTLVDRLVETMASELAADVRPDLVGFTVPFPGCLYAALRMARRMGQTRRGIRVVLGGGYVNTELRSLTDPDIFDVVDFITLDDGCAPLLRLVEQQRKRSTSLRRLIRTYALVDGQVVFHDAGEPGEPGTAEALSVGPDVAESRPEQRIGMMELPNPMHRLWSDGGWNKLMLAQGCYWQRCAFCDTSLDYIRRYRPETAVVLADRIESVIAETGVTGFHFVDEAAPPALLRALAKELLRRKVAISWWGNIRFEKTFTPALARVLADSGCIALTGGLETVCNRTLALMDKGITVEQAVKVAGNLADSGIMVHAYLMYGFPSQTVAETVDALEIVRQMFVRGCLHSAYWHRFALTVHSRMAATPADFGIQLQPQPPAAFARNEIPYVDPSGQDPEPLAAGLRKAIYNFLHGVGFEHDIRSWFDGSVPRPRIPRRFVRRIVDGSESARMRAH